MFNKLKKSLKESGWLVTIAYSVHLLLQKLGADSGLFFYYLYSQPIKKAKEPERVEARQVFCFEWLEEFDDRVLSIPRPEGVLRERFRQGSKCLLATRESAVVACAWFAFDRYHEDEAVCTYDFSADAKAIWDFDVFVFPEYRLGRLFMRLWQKASADLANEGYEKSLSRITAYNRRSISSHERMGAKKVGRIVFLKIGSFQLGFHPLSPWISLYWPSRAKPVVHFECL